MLRNNLVRETSLVHGTAPIPALPPDRLSPSMAVTVVVVVVV